MRTVQTIVHPSPQQVRVESSRSGATCGCGQPLELCATQHCPRCGATRARR